MDKEYNTDDNIWDWFDHIVQNSDQKDFKKKEKEIADCIWDSFAEEIQEYHEQRSKAGY